VNRIFMCFFFEKEIDRIMLSEKDGQAKRDELKEFVEKYHVIIDPRLDKEPDMGDVPIHNDLTKRVTARLAAYDNQAYKMHKSIREYFRHKRRIWMWIISLALSVVIGLIGVLIGKFL